MFILSSGFTFRRLAIAFAAVCLASSLTARPRVVVTTDGEVDDMNTLIRMLHYANEFEWEGIVITSSMWHYAGDGKGTLFTSKMPGQDERYGERTDLRWTGVDWVDRIVDDYAKVLPSLELHADGYPSPDELKALVKVGNISFEGEMEEDTEGSKWIEELLLDEEPGPLWIQVWGGANVVARALKSIEDQYRDTAEWEEIYDRVCSKAILYLVAEQDMTYREYINKKWPGVPTLLNLSQWGPFAYGWPRLNPQVNLSMLHGTWFGEHIKLNHGPLAGGMYLWGDGQQTEGDPLQENGSMEETLKAGRAKYDFISEGDSLAIFHLLPVGLRSVENPEFGGWGGRFARIDGDAELWEANNNVRDLDPYAGEFNSAWPVGRWLPAIQNDFAARADWAVKPYDEANHAPQVHVKGKLDREVSAGATIRLASRAKDPDGDEVSLLWWQYREAGSYPGLADIEVTGSGKAKVKIPEDASSGQTFHFILEGTDRGVPALTRYGRVIVRVK